MRKLCLSLMALCACCIVACTPNEEVKQKAPTITLEKGTATATTLSFKASMTDTTEAAYKVIKDGDAMPTLEAILSEGVAIDTNSSTSDVTATELEPGTKYQIIAAAKNSAKSVGSNTLYMETLTLGEVSVSAEIVQLDHEKMNFRVKAENATKIAYLVLYASKEAPDASYILLNGEEIPVDSNESVEVTSLECAKEYQLLVAAEGDSGVAMAEPLKFTTDDDPANVITHNYTRARGSKYGSNYFIMFSYEDANEADNFAYNDKTLSLDFYGDPDKDYLPAGVYEVKESTEWPCLSSFRYSTYGYDNGVKLKSGQVTVEIDPESKAYNFLIDLYLIDGRHMEATYTGDIDGMPVIDKVLIATTFTSARATTTDQGVSYALTLSDADGNEARLNVVNARKANYLANSAYTISTSSEQLGAELLDVEAGQFDAATSTFFVAGDKGGEYAYATGTLNVDIDWEGERYLISFYATLENGYIIEAEYTGTVEGCSLAQSQEIIDIVMDKASARSYDSNTNWYITFSQSVDGVEKYRLVLDTYCAAAEYLPTGVYKLGVGSGEGYLDANATILTVAGEGQYTFVEASATVTVNMADKSYLFDITGKVEDGRTFKMSYTGAVEGMAITDMEELPTDIEWSSFSARHWYSDNWELTIKDKDEKYVIVLDMRTNDSSLNYIPSGTYTLGDTGTYINNYYSSFNGNKSAYSDVELVLDYNADTSEYALSFDITLTDGSNLQGSYNGPIEGTPKN